MDIHGLDTRQAQAMQASFISKVYGWMAAALVITGFVAMWAASTQAVVEFIFSSRFIFIGLLIVELLCVAYLSAAIARISSSTATMFFIGYAILNGITLSVVFLVFTQESIASTFFVTAGTFGVMSIYGYYTKKDLTSWGNLLFMALIGLVIASLVNMFLHSTTLYWITTFAGVLIFVGLTAYDTQKIKNMSLAGFGDAEAEKKGAVMGALALYLDFINLFLFLLRIFGRRK